MYLFDYKSGENDYFAGKYCSSKLTFSENYHYDIMRTANLGYLAKKIKDSNNPYKDKIVTYLQDKDVVYRMHKKYLAINFKRLLEDATVNNLDITIDLEKDFDNLSDFLVRKIKAEPLIMNLPFKDFNINSYFIKMENAPKINKVAFVNQISIGIERLRRICATYEDEFIVGLVETVFKSPQMFAMICDNNYCLNYELVYNNFEAANPYAFEQMINEMYDKLIIKNLVSNSNYLPENRYFKIIENNRVTKTEEELNAILSNITNRLNQNANIIAKSKFQPFCDANIIKMARDRIVGEFTKTDIWSMLQSGEIEIDTATLYNDLKPQEGFNPYFVNYVYQVLIDIKEIEYYYQKAKISTKPGDLINSKTMDFEKA